MHELQRCCSRFTSSGAPSAATASTFCHGVDDVVVSGTLLDIYLTVALGAFRWHSGATLPMLCLHPFQFLAHSIIRYNDANNQRRQQPSKSNGNHAAPCSSGASSDPLPVLPCACCSINLKKHLVTGSCCRVKPNFCQRQVRRSRLRNVAAGTSGASCPALPIPHSHPFTPTSASVQYHHWQ